MMVCSKSSEDLTYSEKKQQSEKQAIVPETPSFNDNLKLRAHYS